MLYFAYGSNMNIRQMAIRCPDATPVCRYDLPDYRLVFRGVADIIPEKGCVVTGALWRITQSCEATLDRYEGVKSGMYRREFVSIKLNNSPHRALIYRMNDLYYAEPSDYYLNAIAQGFRDFGIPLKSLRAAVNHSNFLADRGMP